MNNKVKPGILWGQKMGNNVTESKPGNEGMRQAFESRENEGKVDVCFSKELS